MIPKPNQLFGALDADSRQRLSAHIVRVPIKLKAIVCEAGASLEHVYFPEGAVLSLLTVMENGAAIETANIGREGAFGLFAAMYGGISFNQCIVQMAGPMSRCPIEVLQAEFERSPRVRNLFVRYSETLLAQIQQSVGCNALHSIEQRMCRWLLMMHDRAEGEPMNYTHEFLADIMAVNRTSVSLAAQAMQKAGLIHYHRGTIQILDRAATEAASCECYAIVRKRFDAFVTLPSSACW